MDAPTICKFVYELTGERLLPNLYQKNVYISCPLAAWTHPKGLDKSRGFSIKVDPLGNSPCKCWHTDCNFSGTPQALLREYERLSNEDVGHLKQWLVDNGGISLDAIIDIDKFEVSPNTFEDSKLDLFRPYHDDWSGFSKDYLLKHWDARYDSDNDRIVFPVRDSNGLLRGAVGRTLNNHRVTYLNYWNFNKSETFFGMRLDSRRRVVIFEGPRDTINGHLACLEHGLDYDCLGLLGSSPSIPQVRLLKAYDEVCLFLDQDKAGLTGSIKLIEHLKDDVQLKFVYAFCGKDAGELSAEYLSHLIKTAPPVTFDLHLI